MPMLPDQKVWQHHADEQAVSVIVGRPRRLVNEKSESTTTW